MRKGGIICAALVWGMVVGWVWGAGEKFEKIAPYFSPPEALKNDPGEYRSVLVFNDGRKVQGAEDWKGRRAELLKFWEQTLGPWPKLLEKPSVEVLRSERREDFTQQRVKVQVAPEQFVEGWLLIPPGEGPFPGVVVPFYEPETSVGLKDRPLLAFALELTRRGFVSLSIGSPGGDSRKPERKEAICQPLSYLGYVAANCHTVLEQHPKVDGKRIGIVGHSYGGKWAMFAACLHEEFAACAVSDPGIVFDESRPNVNYWEPWYIGLEMGVSRKPGVVTKENPRTGPYRMLMETRRDLHELQVLMAPRPFLVSGGSEDPIERWKALNHTVGVNRLLGVEKRVGLTVRPGHTPTVESNEVLFAFFEHFLKP